VDYILLQWMDYNHNEMYCNRDSNHEIWVKRGKLCSSLKHLIRGRAVTASNSPAPVIASSRPNQGVTSFVQKSTIFFSDKLFCRPEILNFHFVWQKPRHPGQPEIGYVGCRWTLGANTYLTSIKLFILELIIHWFL
jgi:hypothetical protein